MVRARRPAYAWLRAWSRRVSPATVLVLGVIVAWRKPENPLSWLILSVGGFLALSEAASFGLIVLLFPDGRLPSPRWRWALWPYLALSAVWMTAAALFTPLRRRVQRAVGRRFNRARHDADQTVARFSARLQDAVGLGAVHGDLLAAVSAPLQPTHLSVWLRERDP